MILVPICQTQLWFTTLLRLLINKPFRLSQFNNLLTHPHSGELHPLRKRLRRMACRVSGRVSYRNYPSLMVSCNTETVPSIAKEMAYVLWWTTGESLQPIRDNRVKFSSCAARTETLHIARGAISAITISTGSHPIISRFTRGIYRQTQPARRYQTIWDVQPVLSYLSGLGPTENLDLKSLTLKVTLSVALVSAQRGQTLHMLNIVFMKDSSTSIECALPAHIKQSRPGYNPPLVILQAYPDDKSPCVFTCLKEYLADTTPQRNRKELIYYLHQATQSYLLSSAGIDIASFKRQRQVCRHL